MQFKMKVSFALCAVLVVLASVASAASSNTPIVFMDSAGYGDDSAGSVQSEFGMQSMSTPWGLPLAAEITAMGSGFDNRSGSRTLFRTDSGLSSRSRLVRCADVDSSAAGHDYFDEDFSSLDNWTVNANGGNVDIISDGLSLSTSGAPGQFPCLVLNPNPFPTSAAFVLRVGMQFTSINPYGDGLVVTAANGNGIWSYWADTNANLSGMDLDPHTLEWDYSNGLQAFLIDGVAQDIANNRHIGNSTTRPTGIRLGNPATVPPCWPWTSFTVSYIEVDAVDSAAASPTSIEPALGDTTTVGWSTTDSTAESIVILDSSGATIDSVGIDLGTADSSGTYSGSVTWAPDPFTPVGHYTIGFGFSDHTTDSTGATITVKPTVYDVYSASGPDDEPEIHYTLSADVTSCGVQVGTDSGDIITGRTDGGTDQSVVWDLAVDSSGGCPPSGTYPVTITTQPQAGPNLLLTTDSPEYPMVSGNPLTITVTIQEPVERPQAQSARLTATIFDSDGDQVRSWLNGDNINQDSVDIDNLTEYSSPGSTAMTWNGNDDSGDPVGSGTYTLVLFARDDSGVIAGAGCESQCVTAQIDITDPPSVTLTFPDEGDDSDDGEASGYTDSAQSVSYSYDGGTTWQTVTPDSTGEFYISEDQTPGPHTLDLRTSNGSLQATASAPYFVNGFTTTSPASDARFDPLTNGSIPLQFTSSCADTVNVYVVDNYQQDTCIGYQNAVTAASVLNGTTSREVIRAITSALAVTSGANSVSWDGLDSAGHPVPPGLYGIVVERTDTDELLDASSETEVVIQHPAGAPQISNVNTLVQGSCACVAWTTSVPTTGYLIYESDDDNGVYGKIAAPGGAAVTHTAWIPGTGPNATYTYCVVATDPTSGASAVSSLGTLTTGNGPIMGSTSLLFASPTEMDITYDSEESCRITPAWSQCLSPRRSNTPRQVRTCRPINGIRLPTPRRPPLRYSSLPASTLMRSMFTE